MTVFWDSRAVGKETKENPKDAYSRFSFVNNRVTPSALENSKLVLKVKMDTVVPFRKAQRATFQD